MEKENVLEWLKNSVFKLNIENVIAYSKNDRTKRMINYVFLRHKLHFHTDTRTMAIGFIDFFSFVMFISISTLVHTALCCGKSIEIAKNNGEMGISCNFCMSTLRGFSGFSDLKFVRGHKIMKSKDRPSSFL